MKYRPNPLLPNLVQERKRQRHREEAERAEPDPDGAERRQLGKRQVLPGRLPTLESILVAASDRHQTLP